MVGLAEEKGRGNGWRSGVAILRPKVHLKIYVHFFIWRGWGIVCITAVESQLVLCACLLGTLLSSLFKCLLGSWLCELLSVNSLYCKKIKSLAVLSSWSVMLPLFYFHDCERLFWEFCWIRWLLCCYTATFWAIF